MRPQPTLNYKLWEGVTDDGRTFYTTAYDSNEAWDKLLATLAKSSNPKAFFKSVGRAEE